MHHESSRATVFASMALPAVSLLYAIVLLFFDEELPEGGTAAMITAVIAIVLLIGTVLAAVRHAEIIARRLREPVGTLVLTLSVTLIEVSIVASMMLHGANNPTLARESVFSVVMIVLTGIIGLSLLVGSFRYGEQEFQVRGTSAFLAVMTALVILVLILPDFTYGAPTGHFSNPQLLFVGVAAVSLYVSFLFIQTVRHREDFLTSQVNAAPPSPPPTPGAAMASGAWLLTSLFAVVFLAKRVAAGVEDGLANSGLAQPDAMVGAFVAFLVLLPEGLASLRAAARNNLQLSLNIALGSALATIGLTIPAVVIISMLTGRSLIFGLDPRDAVLVVLAIVLSIISFGTGRTTLLTGLVHLVVFGAYVLLLFSP